MAMRRLYLDLADLLNIGDRRVPQAIVTELVNVATASDTALVVSREHVQDASRGGDSTLESLVLSVEAFERVVVVMDGPDSVEPLTTERRDISVQACTNFRALAFSSAARSRLATMNDVYDRVHQGVAAAHRVASSGPLPKLRSQTTGNLFTQAIVTLCRGWMGDEPIAIVSYWERELGVSITAEERDAVVARLTAFKEVLPALLSVAAEHDLDITEALRLPAIWTEDRTRWPGRFLGLQIGAARRRNIQRKPRRSDWLDEEHAAHFPYVDVATCDANTLAIAKRALSEMTCPRRAEILPSGHLELLSDWIRRSEGLQRATADSKGA